MVIRTPERCTVDEFDEFVALPENADRLFEFIGGEIIEVVSNNYSSEIAALILYFIQAYIREHGIHGRVTGADGGYIVAGGRYIPDVAYISFKKQPHPSHEAYNANPPDLAVEVLSPGNDPRVMRIKIGNYLKAGTTLWVVDADTKQVEVYAPGKTVEVVDINGTLDGGDVLPGFKLAVKNIFPQEEKAAEE